MSRRHATTLHAKACAAQALTAFEFTVDFFFMTDIILNFRTAIVRNTTLIVDPATIRRLYLRRWFPIDLLVRRVRNANAVSPVSQPAGTELPFD